MFSQKICLIRLTLPQAVVFLLVMSLALAIFLLLLQPLPFSYIIDVTLANRGLNLFLNWLPIFLAMAFLYFIGFGAAAASTVTGAVFLFLGTANRFKILLRNDPLLPWDLFLGGEVMGIARSFGQGTVIIGVILTLLYVLAAIIAAIIIRSKKLDIKFRAVGAISCILLAAILNSPLYNNANITNSLEIRGNIWNQVNQFNSRGFVYSFIHAFNTMRIETPDGYNRAAVLARINQGDTSGIDRLQGTEKPHIIMIMGEAFSEMALLPYFDFTGFTDPLENWRELKTESIHGEIFVPNIGGGTADTEFDVLTGLNTRQFRGSPFGFRMINSEFESMASILNSIGFRSEFMHPGYDWFYNRQNVYRDLGFQRLVFIDEFEGIPTKGMYINEHDTINRVMEMFYEHRINSPNLPYFHFAITIQNHGPYTDKYRYDGPLTEPNFTTSLDVLEIDMNSISNYFHGLADADVELRRLTDYLRDLEEPVVLVYFGDHLPAFNRRIYDIFYPDIYEPGSFEDLTRLFRLPFIIWFNDAAKELYEINHPLDLVDDENILFSSSFLGAYVLEVLGIRNISPFWDFLKEFRHQFPIITEVKSFDYNRHSSLYMTDNERAPLILYRDWSYFRLFEER